MKGWTSIMALAIAAMFLPAVAHAKTISHTQEIPLTKTDWNQALTFPQLPSSKGTLSSVQFTLQTSIQGSLHVESDDRAAGSVTSGLAASMTLEKEDGTPLLTDAPGDDFTDFFAPFDGTLDYAGDSGAQYSIISTGNAQSVLRSPLSDTDKNLFQGDGTVTLKLNAEGVSTFTGAGNLQSESSLSASAVVTIEYTYVSPDLQLTIVPPASSHIGEQTTFVLEVDNVGDGATTGPTTITTTLPSGLTFVLAHGEGWNCSANGQDVTCSTDSTVNPNESFNSISLVTTVNAQAIPSVVIIAEVDTAGDIDEFAGVDIDTAPLSVTTPIQRSSGGGGGGSGGSGGGGSGGGGGGTVNENNVLDFTNALGAFGGATNGSGDLVDAQGCAIGEEYKDPLDAADIDLCFEFVPDRPISFTDIQQNEYWHAIQTLKKTRIIEHGDFIVSGRHNHSSGKQQREWKYGDYVFEPDTLPTRLEVVKIALISNCLPIEKSSRESLGLFTDINYAPSDEALDAFVGDVFDTGYQHDIVEGYPDGTARPFDHANNAEILALLLRAAQAMPAGFTIESPQQWHDAYVQFAREHYLIDADFKPDGHMNRAELSDLVVSIMALSSRKEISAYIAQVDIHDQIFRPQDILYTPIAQTETLDPESDLHCSARAPRINACLGYDEDRHVLFADMSASTPAFDYIDLLRRTYILSTNDYVFSGTDNHSTGKQQEKYQSGTWSFEPGRDATRLEVVKTALVSNCIPVLDYIPRTSTIFTDVSVRPSPENDVEDFVSRVMYTAALFDVLTGDKHGHARPHESATLLETLAALLRTSGAVHNTDPTTVSVDGLPSEYNWALPYVSFAIANGMIEAEISAETLLSPISRTELAELLAQNMEFSRNMGVRSYRTSVAGIIP